MSFELGKSAVEIHSKILSSRYCSRKGAGCVPALRGVFTSVVPSSPESWAVLPPLHR